MVEQEKKEEEEEEREVDEWELRDLNKPKKRKPLQTLEEHDAWAHIKDDPKNFMDHSLPNWVRSPGLKEVDPEMTGEPRSRRVIPPMYEGWAGDGFGNVWQWSSAHVGCQHGDLDMLELASREELEARDQEGCLPAHYAFRYGTSWCVQWLVERGVDTTSPAKDGSTPQDHLEEGFFVMADDKMKNWCLLAAAGQLTLEKQIEAQEYHLHKFLTIPLMEKESKDPDYNRLLDPDYMNKMRLFQFKGPQKPPRKPEWFELKTHYSAENIGKLGSNGNPADRVTQPIALLFPGVGSHYVKMLSETKGLPKVKEMLEKAEKILGYDILDICLNGPESKLDEIRYSSVAMYIASLAGLEKLKLDKPHAYEYCQCVAGMSDGEYTALTAAGVFQFEEGLYVVKKRAEALSDACGYGELVGKLVPKQAMLSVAGLEKSQLESLCEQAKQDAGKKAECKIAMHLFPKGFSCSGTKEAIEKLEELAKKNGALQARQLKSAGAFHTDLMESAQKKLECALVETLAGMLPNRVPIYMGVSGKIVPAGTDPKEIIPMLVNQMVKPILWEQMVKNMIKDGVEEFYEVGPMKQLKAMMKRIDAKVWEKTDNIEV